MTPLRTGATSRARSLAGRLASVGRKPRPPVVVLGTGGSGTRAVAEVMDAAGVYLGPERNRASDSLALKPFLKYQSEAYVTESGWVQAVERDPTVVPDPPEALISELRGALERQREGADSPDALWGWKNPRTTFLLPVFYHVAPDAPTAHLVRDGRDMAYSKNQAQLKDCRSLVPEDLRDAPVPVQSVALWSRLNLAAVAFMRARKPEGHLVVRYEDLCADPATHSERLLRHLGVPVSDAVLQKAVELVKLAPTTGRWKQAEAEEVEAVQRAGEPALREFGYL